ncbi:hypothetical protein DXG01_007511 [Tephrocybe rancida]|nr:hypothetical protein DXG01_007511 [Tephrocybe rancida]
MLTRISALRTIPRLAFAPVRYTSSQVEGSVAQSKGFKQKEKAHEDSYVHQREMELLTKMKAEVCTALFTILLIALLTVFTKIEKKKAELDNLEQKQRELEQKHKE